MSFFSKLFKRSEKKDDFDSIVANMAQLQAEAEKQRLEKEQKRNEKEQKRNSDFRIAVKEAIEKGGPNCDLNFIDTSCITDMSHLFENSNFNGDISKWDVSNVKNMESMFHNSIFNGDISKWNISNVGNMAAMFKNAKFHGCIADWTPAANTVDMFVDSLFSQDEIDAFLCKPFKDPRDGQVYSVRKFGKQIWMTENLRYRSKDSWPCSQYMSGDPRYGKSPSDSATGDPNKLGVLYTFDSAKEACPPGWHIPTELEWEELRKSMPRYGQYSGESDWDDNVEWPKFRIYLAGYRDSSGISWRNGSNALFWSVTEKDCLLAVCMFYTAYDRLLPKCVDKNYVTDDNWSCFGAGWMKKKSFEKNNCCSVRCVKD